MNLRSFLFFLFVLASIFGCQGQISIQIESIPPSTPENSKIYLAGNINNWNPADSNYLFDLNEHNELWLTIPSSAVQIEYKLTRGAWDKVEGDSIGKFRPNRIIAFGKEDTLRLQVLSWEDLDSNGIENKSTANAQVKIWNDAYYIPQLARERRIWVYLPQDYENSNNSYQVLYMLDGQNVFDASTSFAGEWMVDETLTKLEDEGYETPIVVAIDNGQNHRMNEYSPFINSRYGGGEGDEFLDFLVYTLKPQIDSTFRTKTGPSDTGIMGSSMGGLIAHYAHFRNPEVFGMAGIFSPSYWFSDELINHTIETGRTYGSKLYILVGEYEQELISDAKEMYDTFLNIGFSRDQLALAFIDEGQHSEWFWAQEFKAAFLWLFEPQN